MYINELNTLRIISAIFGKGDICDFLFGFLNTTSCLKAVISKWKDLLSRVDPFFQKGTKTTVTELLFYQVLSVLLSQESEKRLCFFFFLDCIIFSDHVTHQTLTMIIRTCAFTVQALALITKI